MDAGEDGWERLGAGLAEGGGAKEADKREKRISDHGHFSSYEGHMERRTGKIRGAFSRMHRAL